MVDVMIEFRIFLSKALKETTEKYEKNTFISVNTYWMWSESEYVSLSMCTKQVEE